MLILNVFGLKHQRTGTKKDGSEFTITYQEAEIIRENRRPRVVEVSAPRNGVYPDGLYTLAETSYRPDMYDRLSLSHYPQLISLSDAIRIATRHESTVERKPSNKSKGK